MIMHINENAIENLDRVFPDTVIKAPRETEVYKTFIKIHNTLIRFEGAVRFIENILKTIKESEDDVLQQLENELKIIRNSINELELETAKFKKLSGDIYQLLLIDDLEESIQILSNTLFFSKTMPGRFERIGAFKNEKFLSKWREYTGFGDYIGLHRDLIVKLEAFFETIMLLKGSVEIPAYTFKHILATLNSSKLNQP